MNYETKRDVFEVALNHATKTGWVDYGQLSDRYATALPDDMPVISKEVGEYITSCKAHNINLHDTMFNWPRSEEEDVFMYCYSEIFASAWLLGAWRVEETGEIVKLEDKNETRD